ncbi:S-layer homology domain-containing protein [Paenisporosarcina cavernae]|nr:S-layer homology domain-containing protein [Paenisporosarcina cavernae]
MKKWLASLAIATMVTTSIGTAEAASASVRESVFSDLSINNKLYESVYTMYVREVMEFEEGLALNGGDRVYPLQEISRAQAAQFLYNLLGLTLEGKTAFTDVSANHPNYEAISTLASNHVVDGYPDGSFHPSEKLTRAQMSKIIANAFQLKESTEPIPFTDVNERFFPYVSAIYAKNITDGKTATQYGSNEFITKQEMAAFMDRGYNFRNASEYNDNEIKMKTNELTRKIRILMVQGFLARHPKPQQLSDIESDLKLLTIEPAYSMIGNIYKASCVACDVPFVMNDMNFELKYNVLAKSDTRIVIESAVAENLFDLGGNYELEMTKQNGTWKLKNWKLKSFDEEPLQLSDDETQEYLISKLSSMYGGIVRSLTYNGRSENGLYDRYQFTVNGETFRIFYKPSSAMIQEDLGI